MHPPVFYPPLFTLHCEVTTVDVNNHEKISTRRLGTTMFNSHMITFQLQLLCCIEHLHTPKNQRLMRHYYQKCHCPKSKENALLKFCGNDGVPKLTQAFLKNLVRASEAVLKTSRDGSRRAASEAQLSLYFECNLAFFYGAFVLTTLIGLGHYFSSSDIVIFFQFWFLFKSDRIEFTISPLSCF